MKSSCIRHEKRMAQEQLEAVHAVGVGRSGLYLGKSQNSSKEPGVLEDTGRCPMYLRKSQNSSKEPGVLEDTGRCPMPPPHSLIPTP